jgi:hypothetical protein
MTLDPRFWLDLVQWVFMGGLAVLMWARKPGEQATERMQNLLQQMGTVQIEMARVQERLAQHEARILNGLDVQERRITRMEDFFMEHFKDGGR